MEISQTIHFLYFEPEDKPKSVSYTHLDVYKRQVCESCVVTVLLSALTIPVVTDCPYPSALPIAIAGLRCV